MIWIFLILGAGILIVGAAVRIILGWVLPTPTMARIDRAANAASTFVLKLSVVALAGLIIYVVWLGYNAPPT